MNENRTPIQYPVNVKTTKYAMTAQVYALAVATCCPFSRLVLRIVILQQ